MSAVAMTALFRVDAGAGIGLGHLQRCLSLAGAWHRAGNVSVFLTNREPAAQTRVNQFKYEAHALKAGSSWTGEDVEATIALARAVRSQAIVVDSDVEGADYLDRLRAAGFLVCAIEDLAPHPFPCQMVVNGDAHAQHLHYISSGGDTRFLLGPEYAMLREEFWHVPPRVVRKVAQQVLVTVGGDDHHRLMPRLLQRLDTIPKSLILTAILGPFFRHVPELETLVRTVSHPVRLVAQPTEVCHLMMAADVAISAGGQTLYELARVGCPAIAIRTAANQDAQMAALEEQGVIQVAGGAEDPGLLDEAETQLRRLVEDADVRSRMSDAGQRFIDGQGAFRVAHALEVALASGQRAIESLR